MKISKNDFHSLPFVQVSEIEFLSVKSKGLPQRHLHHFRKVLRYKNEIHFLLNDGNGRLWEVELDANDNVVEIKEIEQLKKPKFTELICGYVKPKALELIIQKATELGVSKLRFISTDHSVAHPGKTERWSLIIEAACMQAKNPFKPELVFGAELGKKRENEFTRLKDMHPQASVTYLFGSLSQQENTGIDQFTQIAGHEQYCFICGPEGGFSEQEIQFLNGFAFPVSLGDTTLRVETAALCGLFMIKLLTQQF